MVSFAHFVRGGEPADSDQKLVQSSAPWFNTDVFQNPSTRIAFPGSLRPPNPQRTHKNPQRTPPKTQKSTAPEGGASLKLN
ncbi:hypothetical protein cgR_5004 [Corynebacterium glutamicum R]|uniref:Uncharacterized protein n=1 Tax=Corynebacterium glutamicum (strain R) TaxID=340322 RepID=A0AB72V8L5_CORGB|nr:hypothetical protein cgR_5004 [Corynebacterium glutamicum R]